MVRLKIILSEILSADQDVNNGNKAAMIIKIRTTICTSKGSGENVASNDKIAPIVIGINCLFTIISLLNIKSMIDSV